MSKGGKALGLEKALCSSIGECQDRKAGVVGLVSKGREDGLGGFWKPGKGTTFEM